VKSSLFHVFSMSSPSLLHVFSMPYHWSNGLRDSRRSATVPTGGSNDSSTGVGRWEC
jgi:hypothetical protein